MIAISFSCKCSNELIIFLLPFLLYSRCGKESKRYGSFIASGRRFYDGLIIPVFMELYKTQLAGGNLLMNILKLY